MVKLSVLSYKSNSNSRYFPHSGYLGLTPVKVEGVVRTTLDEDRRPLHASSVRASVRCIEARLGRVNIAYSNVIAEYTQLLWSKPEGMDWAELGDGEFPFKIVIPTKTPGLTCANFQDYRVFWRIEAVVEHAPTFGVGTRKLKTYEIPLVRYDTHVPRIDPPPPSPTRILTTRKHRAPVIQYQFIHPTSPIGPLDIVTVQLTLRPVDQNVLVRSASLVVERRMELTEARQFLNRERQDSTSSSPSPSPSPGRQTLNGRPNEERRGGSTSPETHYDRNRERRGMSEPATSTSTGRLLSPPPPDTQYTSNSLTSLSSNYSVGSTTDERPLLNPTSLTEFPAKAISLTVAHVDSTGPFTKDASGAYSKSLSLQWPANKSNSHWAVGETIQTEMIRVRFFIHVKIIVFSPSTGTESIELEERELLLIATNESDRKLAATKYAEASTRSKSKSPKRAKAPLSDNNENWLPSPSPVPPVPQSAGPAETRTSFASRNTSTSAPVAGATAPPAQTLRRPHTSAGLRDKASSRTHSHSHTHTHHRHHEHHRERDRNMEEEAPGKPISVFRSSRRPETARVSGGGTKETTGSSAASTYPYPPTHARRSSREVNGGGGCGPTVTAVSVPEAVVSDPKTVRAWEEELARIERTSRRMSTDILGFNLKRLRMRSTRPKTSSSPLTSGTS